MSAAPGTVVTPAQLPVQCTPVAQTAAAAGNFTVLLAAAKASGGWGGGGGGRGEREGVPPRQPPPTDPPTHAPAHPQTQAAGLADALSSPSLVATVFAPTDAAFKKLLAKAGLSADQLLAQPALLQQVGWG